MAKDIIDLIIFFFNFGNLLVIYKCQIKIFYPNTYVTIINK